MKVTDYQECNCGAITVWFDNGASNSMRKSTFEKLNIDVSESYRLPNSYCCNHCVNHYGIDVCECGSGEPVGKCKCGSNNVHSILGVEFDSFGEILKRFAR